MRSALFLTLVATGGLAGCGGIAFAAGSQRTARVEVKTFMFRPDPLRVRKGTRVTWINRDLTAHTVTSGSRRRRDGRFHARLRASSGRFAYTFRRPGRYRYFCALHAGPGMTAVVLVR